MKKFFNKKIKKDNKIVKLKLKKIYYLKIKIK